MENIRVFEKPDWVTWDDIAECIHIGQATNNKKGFDMAFGHLSPDQLQSAIKGNTGEGYTFVALNEQNKVVGTASLSIENLKKWWHRGRSACRCMGATLPEYRGTEVYFSLLDKLEEKENELGINVIWGTTSENNLEVIKIHKKLKFKFVYLSPSPRHREYYSYVFVKWKKGCPYKDCFLNFMFNLYKFVVPIVFVYNGKEKVNRFTYWMRKK